MMKQKGEDLVQDAKETRSLMPTAYPMSSSESIIHQMSCDDGEAKTDASEM